MIEDALGYAELVQINLSKNQKEETMDETEEYIKYIQEKQGREIIKSKEFRVQLDKILQEIKESLSSSDEKQQIIIYCKNTIHWLGENLKRLGTPHPYPNSYNPSNTIVDPTADGLKL